MSPRTRDLLALVGLLALAAILRLPNLATRGTWDGDQGHDMLVVRALLRDGVTPEQAARHLAGCVKGDQLHCLLFPRPTVRVSRDETLRLLHERLDLFYHGVLREP